MEPPLVLLLVKDVRRPPVVELLEEEEEEEKENQADPPEVFVAELDVCVVDVVKQVVCDVWSTIVLWALKAW